MSASAFGDILRRYRVDAGLSQSVLAELSGLSVETIGALERGTRRGPYRATVDALANALQAGEAGRIEMLAAADRSRARTFAKDAPATRPLSALPQQLAQCIGRSREIAEILGLLQQARIVTITGSAGIGKTRILLEVARQLPSRRREEVRLIDLAALESSDYLLSCIATACGSSAATDFGTIENLTDFLRPQKVMLLLDNCEHIIEDIALVAASILEHCPHVSFLATSRERLAISGEAIYRLQALSPEAGLELMRERISSVDADFESSGNAASGLADICAALDHIPLAIELAAPRVASLGPQAVAARLKGGLSFAGGASGLPARRRTMANAIAWSYHLLAEEERAVLNRLSIFSGGFTLESAASVCGTPPSGPEELPDIVASLVDKSLVNANLIGGGMRYTMFEVIRAFARQRLTDAEEDAATMERLAQWCGDLAAEAIATRNDRTPADLRRFLYPELNNVRSALKWLLESENDPTLAGRIVIGLRPLWQYHNLNAEGLRWAKAALAHIDEAQVPDVASGLLTSIIRWTQGVSVGPWIQRAITVTALTGDRKKLFDLQRSLAFHYFFVGDIMLADEATARAFDIVEHDGLLGRMPHVALLELRVWIRVEQGRLAEALADALTGEAISTSLGEAEPLNWWTIRAFISYAYNDVSGAVQLISAVIERLMSEPDQPMEELLAAYAYLALFQLSLANLNEARTAAREVLVRTRTRTDYWPCTAIALLAVVAAHHGQFQSAARLLGFVDSWHGRQSYLPTIAQRRTAELLRDAVSANLPSASMKAFEAEGALMELRAAVDNALAI